LLSVILFMIVTGIFIHFQINPSSYKKFNDISLETGTTIKIKFESKTKFSTNNEKLPEDNQIFTIDKLTTGSSIFLYIEIALCVILGFLCFKEFQNVLESVKKTTNFQEINFKSFRKIGKYLFLIFILSGFSMLYYKNGNIISFSISIRLLCLTILSFIIAKIIREGNFHQKKLI
ncbi:MAG: hypothetical protein QG594_1552, partial [Bacteroidota bacterium]|nr:hypothetical protein [Bacteroidota bacterium]